MRAFIILSFCFFLPFTSFSQSRYDLYDIYSENGVIGIVFEVDGSGRHGKVMSVSNSHGFWAANHGFDGQYVEMYVGATDLRDGSNNFKVISKFQDWSLGFPIFKEVNAKYGNDWYIPAKEEFVTIAKMSIRLNQILRNNGYDLLEGDYYTSTEASSIGAWAVWLNSANNPRLDVREVGKHNVLKVRAIKRF